MHPAGAVSQSGGQRGNRYGCHSAEREKDMTGITPQQVFYNYYCMEKTSGVAEIYLRIM